MTRVRFEDVVKRANTKEDKDNTDKIYYVGGEHIITDEVLVEDRGVIKGSTIGSAFYFGFKAGQVLFVSRSPDLKKCGMVTFDGICSEKTFVLETKDESVLLQRFLPFVMRSDRFWNYIDVNKSGSVNYFTNWSALANYEFNLPPIEEQARIADLLWAMNDTKKAYRNLLAATDELVKARFVEMFGDYETNSKNWPIFSFSHFAKIDGNSTTDYEKYANYPHIGIDSIEKETGVLRGYRSVREDNVKSVKYIFTPAHIIYSKIRPNLNKVAMPNFTGLCSADAYPILPNAENCNKTFLAFLLRSRFFLDFIIGFSARSNMPKVNRKQIELFKAPLPPLELQEQFECFYVVCEKIKNALERTSVGVQDLMDSVLNTRLVD